MSSVQAVLGADVLSALESVAVDFVGKALEVGCAVARRRGSETVVPSDLSVGLARMWYGTASQPSFPFILKPLIVVFAADNVCAATGLRNGGSLRPVRRPCPPLHGTSSRPSDPTAASEPLNPLTCQSDRSAERQTGRQANIQIV